MMALQSPINIAQRVVIERTEQYGGGWLVYAGPKVHGGIHYQEPDAQLHADSLRDELDWDAWLADHQYGAEVA